MYQQEVANRGVLGQIGCEAASREPRVRAAMQRLSYNNEALHETLLRLVDRLAPVLGPDCANKAGEKTPQAPASCELEGFVEQQTEMVCARIRTMQSILDRLEI